MVEGMFRALRASIESRYSAELILNHWIMGWMIRHARWILSRNPAKADGLTPCQHLQGRAHGGAIC
eukprot:7616542-Pyramimonas_sp.AAC.1